MSTLKRDLKDLKKIEGGGTNLITIFVPNKPNSIPKLNNLIKNEIGSSKNIKLSTTRHSVQEALRIIQARSKTLS